jgi:L-glyceraldehyde 3-phosphate reductase
VALTAGRVPRRPFGRTDLEVSCIGFGCGPTAGLMVRGSATERAAAVERALDLGIDYFDTAPIYGDTVSEQHLGETLHELRASVTLASKVALELPDLDDIRAAALGSVDATLRRLGAERLDVIQLHNRIGFQRAARSNTGVGALITPDDAMRVADAFDELRQQGKVRATGCCAYGGEPEAVAQVLDSGRFDAVLVQFSLANQSAFDRPSPPAGLNAAPVHNRLPSQSSFAIPGPPASLGAVPVRSSLGSESTFGGSDREGGLDYAGAGTRAARNGMAVVAIRTLEAGKLATKPNEAIRFVLRRLEIAAAVIGFSRIIHIEEAARAATMGAC